MPINHCLIEDYSKMEKYVCEPHYEECLENLREAFGYDTAEIDRISEETLRQIHLSSHFTIKQGAVSFARHSYTNERFYRAYREA